jgi:hypothetical protein
LKQVAFLGYVVSKGGIFVDPTKIQDVLGWNTEFSWIGLLLSEVHRRILEDNQAYDRATQEGQEVQVDASL